MFCPKCGTQLPDGAQFCGNCGASLAYLNESAGSQPQTPGESYEADVAEAAAAQTVSTVVPSNTDSSVATFAGTTEAANAPATNTTPVAVGVAPAASVAVPTQAAAPAVGAAPVAAAPVAAEASAAGHKRTGIIALAALALAAIAAGFIIYNLFFSPYNLDDKTFPDQSLRSAIAKQIDFDGDGKISRDQAKEITALNLASSGVSSLEGLNLLPNLHELDLNGCKSLTSADVSALAGLTKLNVSNSGLEALDISRLGGLQELDIRGTKIADLDVSKNANLSSLKSEDSLAVTGLDATQLREEWLVSLLKRSGYCGMYDGFPTGSNQDNNAEFMISYDDQGRVAHYSQESWWEDRKDSYSYEYTYEYDTDNNTILMTRGKGADRSETTYTLNDNGQIIHEKQESFSSGSSSYATEYDFVYDESNRLVARESESHSFEYVYNDAGQLTEIAYVTVSDGSSTRRISALLEYNDAGQLAKLDMDRGMYEFVYNDQGQCSAHYKYWKQYNGNDPFMTGEDWTAITDVTFNKPYTTTYSYNDAGVLISATCEYDDMDNPDYPNASTHTGALEFNDAGMLIKRTYDGVSTYRSDTNETNSVEEFEYTRVFVQKDAAETQSMLTVVDPVAPVRQHSILGSNYRFLDDQQDVVRDIVIGSALYNYM